MLDAAAVAVSVAAVASCITSWHHWSRNYASSLFTHSLSSLSLDKKKKSHQMWFQPSWPHSIRLASSRMSETINEYASNETAQLDSARIWQEAWRRENRLQMGLFCAKICLNVNKGAGLSTRIEAVWIPSFISLQDTRCVKWFEEPHLSCSCKHSNTFIEMTSWDDHSYATGFQSNCNSRSASSHSFLLCRSSNCSLARFRSNVGRWCVSHYFGLKGAWK